MDAKPIPWAQFRAELETVNRPPHRALATYRKLLHVLDLIEGLGCQTTEDLTPTLIAKFVETRPPGESPHTLKSLLCVFRGLSNHAAIMGYVRVSPFALRRVSQWVGRIPRSTAKQHFSREEIRRVLDLMRLDTETTRGWAQWRSRRLYVLTATIAYTGLRRNEALYLHVADIDLADRIIHLTDRGRDGGLRLKTAASEAPVPIPDALASILTDWFSHRTERPAGFSVPPCPWLFPNLNLKGPYRDGPPGQKPLDRLQSVAKRAGVEGMSWLALRHSWATHAEYHGYGPALISRVLRHTSERTAEEHYRHADTANLVKRCRGFNFDA
jgi:integrase